MKIIYRNFTKLLSAGAFGEECVLEPMSKFKWSKLLSVANVYGVSDFVNTGIAQIGSAIIPDGIYEQAKSNVYRSENTQNGKNVNQAYNVGKQKKFSNPYLNNLYSKLVFNEIHNIDTSINSLVLLDKLIRNINTLLDYGVNIREMADLGTYLRTYGDKIDFVKIENWIRLLKIRKICDFICCYLIVLFNFEKEELPFSKGPDFKYINSIKHTLEFNVDIIKKESRQEETDNSEEGIINPIHKPNTHPLKYFSFIPIEASSRFIANICKSLSNIDE